MNDNPILYILLFVAVGFGAIVLLLLLASALMATLGHKHTRKALAQTEASVAELLPGTNCGQCGYPDCAAFAEATLMEDAAVNRCPGCSEEQRRLVEERLEAFHQSLEDPTPPKAPKKRFWKI